MDFKHFNELDAAYEVATSLMQNDAIATELRNMADISELCIIEEWARDNNLISSEQELSEAFDESIAPIIIAAFQQYGQDDIPAMSEAFNNWSDSLCKDDQLHDLQYSEYCYIGKYA